MLHIKISVYARDYGFCVALHSGQRGAARSHRQMHFRWKRCPQASCRVVSARGSTGAWHMQHVVSESTHEVGYHELSAVSLSGHDPLHKTVHDMCAESKQSWRHGHRMSRCTSIMCSHSVSSQVFPAFRVSKCSCMMSCSCRASSCPSVGTVTVCTEPLKAKSTRREKSAMVGSEPNFEIQGNLEGSGSNGLPFEWCAARQR